jgi:hypothetical protein
VCYRGCPYKRNDDLTIRRGLEVVGLLQLLPDQSVVIDFTIDGKDDALILVGERLRARLWSWV